MGSVIGSSFGIELDVFSGYSRSFSITFGAESVLIG